MLTLLRRTHNYIYGLFLKHFRTREVLKTFYSAHSIELRDTPIQNWPMLQNKHRQEIASIKAGKLDIVDRKSWLFPFLPACADEATEILAKRGFIPVADMKKDDWFATKDEDGVFEWQQPTAIHRSHYKGEMEHFVGDHVDAMVTPNHRMVVRRHKHYGCAIRDISPEFELPASKLSDFIEKNVGRSPVHFKYEVPLSALPCNSKELAPDEMFLPTPKRHREDHSKPLRMEFATWLKFLAIYLGDGSCDGTTKGVEFGEGKRPYDQHRPIWDKLLAAFKKDPNGVADYVKNQRWRVRLTCKDTSVTRKEFAELLASMPCSWGAGPTGFEAHNKALWTALFPFGHSYTKYVPDYVKELPTELLEIFAEWLLKADGWWEHGKRIGGGYATTSKRLAEDVLYIFIRLGYGCRLKVRSEAISGATNYQVKFYKKNGYGLIREVKRVRYDGNVYCPSVPNGVICVRRNGKVFWYGNSINRLSTPLAKAVPYNARRFSRTPVPRRAMNIIKSAIISQQWEVRAKDDIPVKNEVEQKDRIRIASKMFAHPNNTDSFQSFLEMGIEDMLVWGAMCTELGPTPDPNRPLKLWQVMSDSIRVFAAWNESTTEMPHYAQMTGLKGERGAIVFYDDEMMYLKDNPSTDSPFGLGKMEVGFSMINYLLGVHDMAGRSGSDQVHKTWLWFEQPQADSAYQILRRHIQNELEGQAKVSIIGGMKKPDVVEIQPVLEQDLLLNWQEMLIRMIANAFDMSAMALGIEHDVNRSTGTVLNDRDFRTAVLPMAMRIQEAFTRKILHAKLGWTDLEFAFLNLDDPDKETMGEMLSRLYSANGLTPNEYRKKLGMQPLDTEFADLTQFECMLINAEATLNLQDRNANRALTRQVGMMQQMQGPPDDGSGGDPYGDQSTPDVQPTRNMPPQQQAPQQKGKPPQRGKAPMAGPPQAGGGKGAQPAKGGIGKAGPSIAAPTALKLPQFPIAGSQFTAAEIAQMPVNDLADRMYSGALPKSPKKLLD